MIEHVIENFDIIDVCYIAIFVILTSMVVDAVVFYGENGRDKR